MAHRPHEPDDWTEAAFLPEPVYGEIDLAMKRLRAFPAAVPVYERLDSPGDDWQGAFAPESVCPHCGGAAVHSQSQKSNNSLLSKSRRRL